MSAKESTGDLAAFSNLDAVALFPDFNAAPERSQLVPLRLPLCLPQGTAGATAAFTRGYSSELQASSVEMGDWLGFVDGLNIAMSASPPLRVVELAGVIIGFVPYHWARLTAVDKQPADDTSMHILAETLTDRYLRRANAEFFAPRGLRVRLCRTAAMRQIIGCDPVPDSAGTESTTSKVVNFVKGAGRVAETVVLHVPIVNKVYNLVAPGVPSFQAGEPGGMAARRITMIEGYALPISFNMPPPAPEEGIMNKTRGLSLRLQTWRTGYAQAKVERKRKLLAIQEGQAVSLSSFPSTSLPSSSQNVLTKAWDWRQARKDELAESIAKWRGERRRVNRNLLSSVEIADRKEWNTTDRLLWIVLLSAEQDAKIQGRELVDSDADVEEVIKEDWEMEMKYEDIDDKFRLENDGMA